MKKIILTSLSICLFSCTKEILTHKLSTDASPLNGGSVTPPSNSFEHGQQVSLTATPNGEYVFKNWLGALSGTTNPTSLLMDADKQVTGVFEKRQYPLNLTIEGNGTVKEEVVAMASQAQYPSGTSVRLTAQSSEGWIFGNWKGDNTSKINPLEIIINKPLNLTAQFKPIPFDYLKPSYELRRNTQWLDYYEIPKQNQVDVMSPGGKSYLGGVAMADFNVDGYLDVVMAPGINRNQRIPIEMYLFDPSSNSFKLNRDVVLSNTGTDSIIKTLIGDFNGDQIPDVFFADSGSEYGPMPVGGWPGEYLSIALSDKQGKFNFQILTQFPKNFYHGACSGDFDRDGDLDIFLPADCSFLINDGKANFIRSLEIFTSPVKAIISCEMLDVDKDGFLDLVVGGQNTYADLRGFIDANRIYWGNGKNFDKNRSLALPELKGWDLTLDIGMIDLNQDSKDELILLRTGDSSGNGPQFYMGYYLQILSGDKNAYKDVTSDLVNVYTSSVGRNIPSIVVGDINRNGLIDIVHPDKGTSYGSPNNKNSAIFWEKNNAGKLIK
ncbi:FG-GAP-like repeat-containing protein [Aquirufa sp. 5-AUSEE-100C1]